MPVDQRAQAGRAVEREPPLAGAQVERLDHPEEAEPVVEVEVGDEDRVELRQADGAQQLLLRALAAVEEQPVAARAHEQGGQAAPRGGGEPAVPAKKSDSSIGVTIEAPGAGALRPRRVAPPDTHP